MCQSSLPLVLPFFIAFFLRSFLPLILPLLGFSFLRSYFPMVLLSFGASFLWYFLRKVLLSVNSSFLQTFLSLAHPNFGHSFLWSMLPQEKIILSILGKWQNQDSITKKRWMSCYRAFILMLVIRELAGKKKDNLSGNFQLFPPHYIIRRACSASSRHESIPS